MSTDWIPAAGDIITPITPLPFYVGGRLMDLQPGMLLTVLYSEEPAFAEVLSLHLDVYHPDLGKRSIIVNFSYWTIVNRQTKENA